MRYRVDPDEPAGFEKLRQRHRGGFSRRADTAHLRTDTAQQAGRDAGCHKRPYGSKADADAALRRINAENGQHLRRAYRCPRCGHHHLTRQAFRG